MDDQSVLGPYVRACVGLSSALWQNGGSDPDAVWHHRSDESRDEAGSAVWGSVHVKGYFWGEFRARHCNHCGLHGVCVRHCATRPSSQITLGRLVGNNYPTVNLNPR